MIWLYDWLARGIIFVACAIPILLVLGFSLAVEYPRWKEEHKHKDTEGRAD